MNESITPIMTRLTLLPLVTLSLLGSWLSVPATGQAAEAPSGFPAVGNLPVQAELPDPLIGADSQAITTAAQWAAQRERMKAIIQHCALGRMRGKFSPELWDPHSGAFAVPESTNAVEDGQPVTRVKLSLGPIRSCFIIGRR